MQRILAALVIAFTFVACQNAAPPAQPETPAAPPAAPAVPAEPATPAPAPTTPAAPPETPAAPPAAAAHPATPATKLPAGTPPGTYANFVTSKGDFTARLFTEDAPKTVENFIGLATGKKAWQDPRSGAMIHRLYYNNVLFHRVIPRFMIQGGDPLGTGMGGPGFTIPDEISPKYRFDRAGLLAMANLGRPNTGGGQFFITVAPYPSLNGGYTVFGEIVEGMANVVAISQVPRGGPEGSRPLTPVTIKTVTIETVK